MLGSLSAEERNAILYKTPAMAPPRGLEPNFHNPESRAYLPVTVTAGCLSISVTCAILRAYSRIVCQRVVTIEDGKSASMPTPLKKNSR